MSRPAPRTRNSPTKAQRHKGPAELTDPIRLLREARGSISGADAEYLLMHILHARRHELFLGRAIPARAASRFRRLVARAGAGEPVQYLVHSAPFLDFCVYVDRRVLVPRPETEELVARAIARVSSCRRLQAVSRKLSAVDFGTGSGCIAIALARVITDVGILAVDASRAALTVAARNVSKHGLAGRIRLKQAKSLSDPALARLRGRLDLLISNPPYVPTPRLARLPANVRQEPRLALDGGPKGANIVAMLLEHGPVLLKPNGLMAIEIDADQEATVRRLAPRAELERDLAGRIRYVFLTKQGQEV